MKKGRIDIVVGGQFGDEGKGQICAHLVNLKKYDFSVRVGGSNAEHRFKDLDNKTHVARVLPVAAWIDPNIEIYLGAGHVIKVGSFLVEKTVLDEYWGTDQSPRIHIDPQAGVISPGHCTTGTKNWHRGTTRQGVGASVAHKVLRDGKYILAKDYHHLKPYINGRVNEHVQLMLETGKSGILEGNQGALLALNHGYYPWNTSKDVTPSGLIAELGIAMHWVEDIFGVYRCVPMRVPGQSGPSEGKEMSWEDLEAKLHHSIPEKVKRQTDSGDRERVFEWSWEEFKYSTILVGPTKMALTFIDWYCSETPLNDHIAKMQDIANCPVVITRDGSNWDDMRMLEST